MLDSRKSSAGKHAAFLEANLQIPLPVSFEASQGQVTRLLQSDLVVPSDIKAVVRDIHDHLAANATSISRNEVFAQQLILLLFLKLHDETSTPHDKPLSFAWMDGETEQQLKQRLRGYFDTHVHTAYPGLFDRREALELDPPSLAYAVSHLQRFSILRASRDVIGDAFEAVIGYALKGPQGQFFTPRNAIRLMVEIVDLQPGMRILDVACGSGGFLVVALERLYQHLQRQAKEEGWSREELARRQADVVRNSVRGIDKDRFLAKIARTYLTMLSGQNAVVVCENSLAPHSSWDESSQKEVPLESFDVVLTNPPFGKNLTIKDPHILTQFELGHKWKPNQENERWLRTASRNPTPPQILFVERCLHFLKDGGKLGIVMPESLLGNPSYGYVVEFIKQSASMIAVLSMPEELFQPYTHTKSCLLILQKGRTANRYTFFMGIARWCGHNSRGNLILSTNRQSGKAELLDDLPKIGARYRELSGTGHGEAGSRLGFLLDSSSLRNNILIPKYYEPEIDLRLRQLCQTHDIVEFGKLMESGAVSLASGVEIGRLSYGTGEIPFIRTSDISNWELRIDPKHSVSREVYTRYKRKAEVREGDILLVRDGTYLVGTCCILTKYDPHILYQSHIYRIRVNNPVELDPFLVFAVLNSPTVKRQIWAKRFTQDIIDTLGMRITELKLPMPRDPAVKAEIARRTRLVVEERAKLRAEARRIRLEVEGLQEPPEWNGEDE